MPIFSEKPHTKIKFQDFGKASAFTSKSKKTARTVGESFFRGGCILSLGPPFGAQNRPPGAARTGHNASKKRCQKTIEILIEKGDAIPHLLGPVWRNALAPGEIIEGVNRPAFGGFAKI